MPRIEINEARCKGCGLCTTACPHKLVSLGNTPNSYGINMARFLDDGRCTGCTLCAQLCPDVAIFVYREES